MAAATMTSRVLGMVREMVYASFMGTGWVASAFTLAFMVPNLFRRLLGEGALTAAFIPIFKQKEKTAGPAEMWRAANAVISGLLVSGGAITMLAILGISVVLGVGSFPAGDDADVATVALHVSLHVAGVSGGGAHRDGECARAFLRAGAGRGAAQRGDDRERVVDDLRAAVQGFAAGPTHLRAGRRRGAGGLGAGVFQSPACARGFPVSMGFAVGAIRRCARS
jgi:hypothetical protein